MNQHDMQARRRYTLAHEIAHFLLHRHLLRDGITDDVLYRSSQSSQIEAEANRLAADIIMPMHQVD
ncbi:ImmA/IrrE family metallo-endopeptidase, partial [Escherichia coli]|nr:ImmA/IrrE family metallo-endopeptidase [Escherichia coli]